MPRSRQLVYVSGAPGAGKTHLAGPLAAELGFALIAKDKIKETLHDALGKLVTVTPRSPSTSRRWPPPSARSWRPHSKLAPP